MSKVRLFLFSGLASTLLTLTLIKTGILVLHSDHLLAQHDENVLNLRNQSGDEVSISKGKRILIKKINGGSVYGYFLALKDDSIVLELKKRKTPQKFSVKNNNVEIIYLGNNIKNTSAYLLDGLKIAGGFSFLGGLSMGSLCAHEYGKDMFSAGFVIGAGGALLPGIPAAIILSLLREKVAKNEAIKYIISSSEWKIISNSISTEVKQNKREAK
ncbi:MAG: hypothetical protein CMG08_07120 [Candidatus Marinimicrobia bacterium]|nr:hypothetical protein [Candidatus Neomarinimicrobiota bacterium]